MRLAFTGILAIAFSCSVALAGSGDCASDVNGDGVRDVLVGAPRADEGAVMDVGEVTVWFGNNDAVDHGSGTLLVFQGDIGGEQAGTSVAFIRDITGDGIDERRNLALPRIHWISPLFTRIPPNPGTPTWCRALPPLQEKGASADNARL